MRINDWSSDVCSSDLRDRRRAFEKHRHRLRAGKQQVRSAGIERRACLLLGCAEHAWRRADQDRERHSPFGFRPTRGARRTRPARERARQLDRSEEHTSELQSLMRISYAVFCLKKKKTLN